MIQFPVIVTFANQKGGVGKSNPVRALCPLPCGKGRKGPYTRL